jgi:hypothetical protein
MPNMTFSVRVGPEPLLVQLVCRNSTWKCDGGPPCASTFYDRKIVGACSEHS